MNVIDHRDWQDPQCKPTKPAVGSIEFTRDQDTIDQIAAALTLQRWNRERDKRAGVTP